MNDYILFKTMQYGIPASLLVALLWFGFQSEPREPVIHTKNYRTLPQEVALAWNRKGKEKLWVCDKDDPNAFPWENVSHFESPFDHIPELLIEAAAETLRTMIDAAAADIEIDADSGIDPNTFFAFWPQGPQIEYVIDADSDPLMVGTMLCTWMKSQVPFSSIIIEVPKKDKAIYDAIYYSKPINPPERNKKCKNSK